MCPSLPVWLLAGPAGWPIVNSARHGAGRWLTGLHPHSGNAASYVDERIPVLVAGASSATPRAPPTPWQPAAQCQARRHGAGQAAKVAAAARQMRPGWRDAGSDPLTNLKPVAEPIRAHPASGYSLGGQRPLSCDSRVALDRQRPGPGCGGVLVGWRSACQAAGSRTGSQISRPTGSQGPRHHTVAACRVVLPW
jgi:hypothetical protein